MSTENQIDYIPVIIPQELKDMFERDHRMLFGRLGGFTESQIIREHLQSNNVLEVRKCVNKAFSPLGLDGDYGDGVKKEGFFKEFPEWLDFALGKIMESRGITFYNSLRVFDIVSEWLSVLTVDFAKKNVKEITRSTVLFVNKKTDRRDPYDQLQLENACKLIFKLYTKELKAEDLADISYAAFQSAREKESGMGE